MGNTITKVFSKKEKQHYVDLWQQSSKSKKAFSEEQGIKYNTFIGWTIAGKPKRVYSRKIKSEPSEKSFIPLVVEPLNPNATIFAEIYFSAGHRIIFHGEIPTSLFSLLLK